ncbi:hypothetical protein JTB14_037479 [Gonioctena quinquepunctata]|nr:hypothetical protein JTB14_037479 [Gonioctena quinquepunctata]
MNVQILCDKGEEGYVNEPYAKIKFSNKRADALVRKGLDVLPVGPESISELSFSRLPQYKLPKVRPGGVPQEQLSELVQDAILQAPVLNPRKYPQNVKTAAKRTSSQLSRKGYKKPDQTEVNNPMCSREAEAYEITNHTLIKITLAGRGGIPSHPERCQTYSCGSIYDKSQLAGRKRDSIKPLVKQQVLTRHLLNEVLEEIKQVRTEINSNNHIAINRDVLSIFVEFEHFPIDCTEKMNLLEEHLGDASKFKAAVNEISKIGGGSLCDSIKPLVKQQVLTRHILNEVLEEIKQVRTEINSINYLAINRDVLSIFVDGDSSYLKSIDCY